MSYCVNCGVKLRNSEKKCPLCNTEVYNPNIKKDNYTPAYSNKLEKLNKINYKYLLKLSLEVLALVSFIFLLCDYITSKHISWSIYVVLVIFYLTCQVQYVYRKNIYINHTIEFVGTLLFALMIALLNNGMVWFRYLVLPFAFISWIELMLCTMLVKIKKINALRKVSICLITWAMFLVCIETYFDLFFNNVIKYSWSLYASLPIIVLSIIAYIISYNNKLMDEIKQRIFI